ncbi:unnamed protein product, partial [Sphenostylis stenocarpa]
GVKSILSWLIQGPETSDLLRLGFFLHTILHAFIVVKVAFSLSYILGLKHCNGKSGM